MLEKIDLEKVLFLDIETVPQYASFSEAPEVYQKLWEKKAQYLPKDEGQSEADIYGRAGIYAEFGKIVCISVGFVRNTAQGPHVRITSFADEDEATLLTAFCAVLNKHYSSPYHALCGHNGKEFDFPYIARRLLILGMPLPSVLNIAGKKPWEVQHLDTMELWKFGDYKNFTSLELLTHVFDIPTPKDDMDGSMVGTVYWQENDLARIRTYCEKDVLALIQLMQRYRGQPLLSEEHVEFV